MNVVFVGSDVSDAFDESWKIARWGNGKSVKFASLVGQHGTIFDVAEINQQRLLEESEQWLENLVQTYLVLTSGKLVLQKSYVH